MSQLVIKSNTINSTLETPINQGIKNDADSEILKPRADLPPELQNARPSKRGILARIGAFLFGAGAAGGAAFGFGAGGVIGGLIGVGATAAVGIATGGAALIGGAVALGLYAGIKAIVSHFRRAPDPEPRLQEIIDTRPQAEIDKEFNIHLANNTSWQHFESMPEGYLDAANAACREFSGKFRSVNVQSLVQLLKNLQMGNDLYDTLLAHGDKRITPEQYAADIKDVLFRHAKTLMLAEKVRAALPQEMTEASDRTVQSIAERIIERLKNAGAPLFAEFDNARTNDQINAFLAKTDGLVKDAITLHANLKAAVMTAKQEADRRLSELLGIPAEQVHKAKVMSQFRRKLDETSTSIKKGDIPARPETAGNEFVKAVDKFIGGFAGMVKEIDESGATEQQKAKWKENLLNGGKIFPQGMHVISTVTKAAANADVSALIGAVSGGGKAEDILETVKTLGRNLYNQVLKEIPEMHEKFTTQSWGSEEVQEVLAYVWSTILDANPALKEAFAKRPQLVEQLGNMMLVIQNSNSPSRMIDAPVVGVLTDMLQNP